MSIFFTFPPAKNATLRLSGDQNGCTARSVPGTRCTGSASSERTHRLPSEPENTTRRPSGEIAGLPVMVMPSGGAIVKRIVGVSVGVSRTRTMPRPNSAAIVATRSVLTLAVTQAIRSRPV